MRTSQSLITALLTVEVLVAGGCSAYGTLAGTDGSSIHTGHSVQTGPMGYHPAHHGYGFRHTHRQGLYNSHSPRFYHGFHFGHGPHDPGRLHHGHGFGHGVHHH